MLSSNTRTRAASELDLTALWSQEPEAILLDQRQSSHVYSQTEMDIILRALLAATSSAPSGCSLETMPTSALMHSSIGRSLAAEPGLGAGAAAARSFAMPFAAATQGRSCDEREQAAAISAFISETLAASELGVPDHDQTSRRANKPKQVASANATVTAQQKKQQQQVEKRVPRKGRLRAAEVTAQGITTVMMHQIAPAFSQQDLIRALDADGFNGCYDYVYLPPLGGEVAPNQRAYAFINFRSPEDAASLVQKWAGSRFAVDAADGPSKTIFFSPAVVQGLAANLLKMKKTRSHRIPFVASGVQISL